MSLECIYLISQQHELISTSHDYYIAVCFVRMYLCFMPLFDGIYNAIFTKAVYGRATETVIHIHGQRKHTHIHPYTRTSIHSNTAHRIRLNWPRFFSIYRMLGILSPFSISSFLSTVRSFIDVVACHALNPILMRVCVCACVYVCALLSLSFSFSLPVCLNVNLCVRCFFFYHIRLVTQKIASGRTYVSENEQKKNYRSA